MRGIKQIQIEDVSIFRAVWKCYEDYKRKLTLLPASFGGHHHPVDERGVGGLVKHIEKMCWYVWKYWEEFNISINDRDILMAAAFFHDIGSVEVTHLEEQLEVVNDADVVRRKILTRDFDKFMKHPIISAEIAEKYLEKEGVDRLTLVKICNIVKSHMAHWYKGMPLPKTHLEKIFALGDYLMTREELDCQI